MNTHFGISCPENLEGDYAKSVAAVLYYEWASFSLQTDPKTDTRIVVHAPADVLEPGDLWFDGLPAGTKIIAEGRFPDYSWVWFLLPDGTVACSESETNITTPSELIKVSAELLRGRP